MEKLVLDQIVEIKALLKQMSADIKQLQVIILKSKINDTWVDEDVAAAMLGLAPRTLRRMVTGQNKGWPMTEIRYRSTNGRSYKYSRKGIISYQDKTATG